MSGNINIIVLHRHSAICWHMTDYVYSLKMGLCKCTSLEFKYTNTVAKLPTQNHPQRRMECAQLVDFKNAIGWIWATPLSQQSQKIGLNLVSIVKIQRKNTIDIAYSLFHATELDQIDFCCLSLMQLGNLAQIRLFGYICIWALAYVLEPQEFVSKKNAQSEVFKTSCRFKPVGLYLFKR